LSKKHIGGKNNNKKNLTTDFYSLIHVKIGDRTMREKEKKIEFHMPLGIKD
jgi:hypothetical protein